MNDEFADEQRVETFALTRAMALIEIVADPERVAELKEATAAHAAQRSASEHVLAEATSRSAALEEGEASLARRTAEFQTWVDATEKAYREREHRIATNEDSQSLRERNLLERESDFVRRASAHERRLQTLKETLA
jgi:hypothetical protein